MPTLKGTKTANNLLHAFAGESQARNRYTYYSSIAKKEGYVQIANIFEETANQEIATLIILQLLKKKDMYKSLISLKKLLIKKKNMQKD